MDFTFYFPTLLSLLFIYLFVCLFVYLFVCLFVYLFVVIVVSNLKEVQSVQNEKVRYMKGMEQYKTQTENLSLIIQQLETA